MLTWLDEWNTPPSSRVISDNTGSLVSLQIAKKWLNDCVTGHALCTPEPRSGRWYPSRLLDLDDTTQDGLTSLRLITTKSQSLEGHYTTLSHRWGQAKFLQLTRHNLEDFHREIPIAELPQTFRDAILVSKALQIRYLWVDSLCIVQDDASDWAFEASQMHMVYSNSHCNISASHAEDSTGGLFRDRDSRALCSTEVDIGTENFYTTKNARQAHVLTNGSLIRNSIDDCPLSKHGWVLQERILAPRVLHFSRDQVFFECRTRIACELYDTGVPDIYYKDFPTASAKVNHAFRNKDRGSWYWMWRNLVQMYSTMSLTYPSDKLAAVSGIAKMVQSVVHDEYVAGMWREDLVVQLLWHSDGQTIRPLVYRAPSWSWTSVDGKVDLTWYFYDRGDMDAEIVDLHIEYATEDKTGQILGGWLDLKGTLWSVQLERNELRGTTWLVYSQDGDEESYDLWAHFDDASLEDDIIVQQSAAGEHFFMYLAGYCLILRLSDHTNKLYERIGIAQGFFDPRELGKERLPCIRYEDGKHTIRII